MAHVIAVANLKGGVGKSTLSVNLACALARGSRVTIVDADSQATATAYGESGTLPATVLSLPLDGANVDGWLRRVLAIAGDFTVIDCPPHVGATTQAAVGISDLVLVPVTPSAADLRATSAALALVRAARDARKNKGPACLLVPSRVDTRTSPGREIGAALKDLGEPVGPPIGQRTAFVDALTAGQWVGEYAPGSPAHDEIVALARIVKGRLS